MRILLSSYVFYPSLGGIETISMLLAESFAEAGHEVVVVTYTPSDEADRYPFEICRRPTPRQVWGLVKWCDLFFHSNITLKNIWPLLFLRRPWVATHQTWITATDGTVRGRDVLKQIVLHAAKCISISHEIASSVFSPSLVIPNSFNDRLFRKIDGQRRRKNSICFVGRLVSDKGADILLDAAAIVDRQGIDFEISIIGEGPERGRLEAQSEKLGLQNKVRFRGKIVGEALASELRSHEIMVVPSRWKEPFGIVALEGLGCGCVVVGSVGGGLRDAIGPCGPTFQNGDYQELAGLLENLLASPQLVAEYRSQIRKHLKRFTPGYIAAKYLSLFESIEKGGHLVPRPHSR